MRAAGRLRAGPALLRLHSSAVRAAGEEFKQGSVGEQNGTRTGRAAGIITVPMTTSPAAPGHHDEPGFRQTWDFLANELPPDLSHRRPCALGPPEAFSDEPAPDWLLELWADHGPLAMGPASSAVRRRIALSCAGWNRKPTTAEFYAAIHASNPDPRQQALISMWAHEADLNDIVQAYIERVYTIRDLVAAFHRVHGLYTFDTFRWLNGTATTPHHDGVNLWTC